MKSTLVPRLAAGLATSAALLCLPAHAEGLYVGANLGVPHFGDSGINGIAGSGSGASGKVYLGYQFIPYFGLEAGGTDLGRISNGNGSVNGHGEYLDAVGTLPLGNAWSLFGSLGVAHVSLTTSRGDSSGDGLKLGAGTDYALSSHLSLRAEWERYRPDTFGTKPNLDQYTLGVRYGF
jgi:OOP family OmpA-OmpF porin